MIPPAALLDTSIFIARESGRSMKTELMPTAVLVSVITIGELEAGVHAARNVQERSERIKTLSSALDLDPLPVDVVAAGAWARLRARLAEEKRRANVNDLWIAAIALANHLPVVTQDDDFDVIAEVGGPELIRV